MLPHFSLDIDYDYRRSDIYVTTNNGTIICYNVTVTQSNNDIMLSHTDTAVIYSDLGTVGSITVDWVNDRVYWIKFESNMSQVNYLISTYTVEPLLSGNEDTSIMRTL